MNKFLALRRSQIVVRLLECDRALLMCKPGSVKHRTAEKDRKALLFALNRKDDELIEKWNERNPAHPIT